MKFKLFMEKLLRLNSSKTIDEYCENMKLVAKEVKRKQRRTARKAVDDEREKH